MSLARFEFPQRSDSKPAHSVKLPVTQGELSGFGKQAHINSVRNCDHLMSVSPALPDREPPVFVGMTDPKITLTTCIETENPLEEIRLEIRGTELVSVDDNVRNVCQPGSVTPGKPPPRAVGDHKVKLLPPAKEICEWPKEFRWH